MAKKKQDKQKEAAASEDVLIREVDDELRAEKLHTWWQQFGSLLVGACVIVVLATIAYQLASSYRTSQAEHATAILLEAQKEIDRGQTDTALTELKPLTEENSEAAELAKLQAAYLTGDEQSFKALAQEADNKAIADASHLQATNGNLKKDSVFYSLEAEQKAVRLLNEGKKEEARTLLLALLDRNDIPASQRQRLNELLQGAN